MRRVAIVVSLHCASALVTGFADRGLPLPAAAADARTELLADQQTGDGNDRVVLLSALGFVGLVQQLSHGWPAPGEAWPVGHRAHADLARAPPASLLMSRSLVSPVTSRFATRQKWEVIGVRPRGPRIVRASSTESETP
jgi:hypothetical protein